jgi:uncharacterized cupin superfamily protein
MGTTLGKPQEICAAAQRHAGLDRSRSARPNGRNERTAMTLLQRVTREGTQPEITRPDPDKVTQGDPVHTTWNLDEVDGLYAGIWQSTPGAWKVSYAEWEYIYIHSGHSILRARDGTATHLRAGDSYLIRPGFEGVWEVVETTLKDYVIRT